jgi:hypothetical protein
MIKERNPASATDPDQAEELVAAAYLQMYALAWRADNERQIALHQNDHFKISLVECRSPSPHSEPQLRLEILERNSKEIVIRRGCDDLEHAVEIFVRLRSALGSLSATSDRISCSPIKR